MVEETVLWTLGWACVRRNTALSCDAKDILFCKSTLPPTDSDEHPHFGTLQRVSQLDLRIAAVLLWLPCPTWSSQLENWRHIGATQKKYENTTFSKTGQNRSEMQDNTTLSTGRLNHNYADLLIRRLTSKHAAEKNKDPATEGRFWFPGSPDDGLENGNRRSPPPPPPPQKFSDCRLFSPQSQPQSSLSCDILPCCHVLQSQHLSAQRWCSVGCKPSQLCNIPGWAAVVIIQAILLLRCHNLHFLRRLSSAGPQRGPVHS